jgi:uncharacterized protein YkwD
VHKSLKFSAFSMAIIITLISAANTNASGVLDTSELSNNSSSVADKTAGQDRRKQGSQHRQIQCNKRQILTVEACRGDELSAEERKLYQLVNQYRSRRGLPPIPLSASLTKVANRHVLDLQYNFSDLTHSWSDCPYDSNRPSTYKCMWEAPQRLGTSYRGNGYENAYGSSDGKATAEDAFSEWLDSRPHHEVIVNQGIWEDVRWNALGIGIHKGYAVLWFGKETD